MSIGQQILHLLLPQSKAAEAVTNTVAGAGVAQVILPPWWPSQESLTHDLAIIYLVASILWIVVQIGFKFVDRFKGETD